MAERDSNSKEASSNDESAEIFTLNNVQVVTPSNSSDLVQLEQRPLELTPPLPQIFRSEGSSSQGRSKEPRIEKLIYGERGEHLAPSERIQQPISSDSVENERFSRATVSTGSAESERHSLANLPPSSSNDERGEHLVPSERIQQPISSYSADYERFSRATVSTGIDIIDSVPGIVYRKYFKEMLRTVSVVFINTFV